MFLFGVLSRLQLEKFFLLSLSGLASSELRTCRSIMPGHSGGYFFRPPPYVVPPGFSSRRPKPRLNRKRIGSGLASTFHARMSKRGRR